MLMAHVLLAAITGPVDVSQNGFTAATVTIPITNTASGNVLGIVNFGVHDSTDADRALSSITWGGTNMTQAGYNDEAVGNKSAGQYYIINPPTGSNNVVIRFAGTCSGVGVSVTTWQGIDQTTPLNASTTRTNTTSTVISVTSTSSVGGVLWIDQYTKYLTTGTVTPAADQTVIGNAAIGAAYWEASTYNNTGLAAGAKTFTYTNSLTSASINILGAYKPAAEAATTTEPQKSSDLRLLGVGR